MIIAQGGEALVSQSNALKDQSKDNSPDKGDFMNQVFAGRQSQEQGEKAPLEQSKQDENYLSEGAETRQESANPNIKQDVEGQEQDVLQDRLAELLATSENKQPLEIKSNQENNPLTDDLLLGSTVTQQTTVVSGKLKQGELVEQRWYAQGKLSYDVKADAMTSKGVLANDALNTAKAELGAYERSVNSFSSIQKSGDHTRVQQAAVSQVEAKTQSRKLLASSSTSSAHSLASVPEYLKKKLTFVEKDQQLDIFVRDYELSETEKKQLAGSLIQHFHNLGTSINQVFINGQRFSR